MDYFWWVKGLSSFVSQLEYGTSYSYVSDHISKLVTSIVKLI